MSDRAGVAILAKAPELAKRRLVPVLGVERVALLATRLIERTTEIAVRSDVGPVTLWATPSEQHPLFRALAARHRIALARQSEEDLGARMLRALTMVGGPALVIGADCPVLTAGHLRSAAHVLDTDDAVVLPAEDGGYVLIGMRAPCAALFADIPWGMGRVMGDTRRRLSNLGLAWQEPVLLWDLDLPSDLERLHRMGVGELPS
jgi:rSAM/selenodomain-associated transferase 1